VALLYFLTEALPISLIHLLPQVIEQWKHAYLTSATINSLQIFMTDAISQDVHMAVFTRWLLAAFPNRFSNDTVRQKRGR